MNAVIVDSISKSSDTKAFFSNLFGFDEGFVRYLRGNMGSMKNKISPSPLIWDATLKMKFVPQFLIKGNEAAARVQVQAASRVVDGIIAHVGSASELAAAAEQARASAVEALLPRAAPKPGAAASNAKKTMFLWAPEVSENARAKVLGVGKKGATVGMALAALSLAYMFLEEQKAPSSQTVPKKVK